MSTPQLTKQITDHIKNAQDALDKARKSAKIETAIAENLPESIAGYVERVSDISAYCAGAIKLTCNVSDLPYFLANLPPVELALVKDSCTSIKPVETVKDNEQDCSTLIAPFTVKFSNWEHKAEWVTRIAGMLVDVDVILSDGTRYAKATISPVYGGSGRRGQDRIIDYRASLAHQYRDAEKITWYSSDKQKYYDFTLWWYPGTEIDDALPIFE